MKRRGEAAFRSFRADLDTIARRATVVGTAAAAALTVVTKRALENIDSLTKFADRIGIATDKLAGLRLAGELTGVQNNQLDLGLQRMTRRVSEAAQGMGEAQSAIRELGLDAEELSKLPVDQQFAEIADKMSLVPDQADRVRLAFKLFDSEGVALVNTLALGRQGLEDVAEQAIETGLAFNRIDAAKVEAANDAMTLARSAAQGWANVIAIQLSPIIQGMAGSFSDSATSAEDMGRRVNAAIDGIATGAGFVADAFYGWRLIFAGIELQVLKILALFDQFRSGDPVNDLLREIDSLTEKVNTARIDGDAFGVHQYTEDLEEAQQALKDLLLAGDVGPSTALQDFLSAEETFNNLVAAQKPSEAIAETISRWREEAQAAAEAAANIPRVSSGVEGLGESASESTARELAEREAERQRMLLESNLEAVRQFTLSKEQIELEAMQRRLEVLALSREQELIGQETFQNLSIEVARRGQEALTQIANEGAAERTAFLEGAGAQQAQNLLGSLAAMTAGTAQHNKTMFKLNKAAAIGNAIISTAQGVAKALELPFPFNLAAAAVVAAAGAAQIQTIKATSFGGGTTPSLSGSTGVVNGQPVQSAPSPADRDSGRRQLVVNVNVQGSLIGAGGPQELGEQLTGLLRTHVLETDDELIPLESNNGLRLSVS